MSAGAPFHADSRTQFDDNPTPELAEATEGLKATAAALEETRAALALRDAEVAELKQQVAELSQQSRKHRWKSLPERWYDYLPGAGVWASFTSRNVRSFFKSGEYNVPVAMQQQPDDAEKNAPKKGLAT